MSETPANDHLLEKTITLNNLLESEKAETIQSYIENNLTSIDDLACAFVKFENCFGKVKYKYIKGDLAKNFCNSIEQKEKGNPLRVAFSLSINLKKTIKNHVLIIA